ncbi:MULTISPECIES: hypothetical protein [unclassified Nocardiopsis]|uniref:hypothetical protein n=1 Tax=unclassified Nocardiopsis TaxID=2649073 RepID=UPI00135AD235|nr:MULTISPECIES: hypothetical protein [unclassified Nocardiopsis]
MDHSKIPHFPKITADITQPEASQVTVNGVEHTVTGTGVDELRQAVIEHIVATATKIGRPVRATTTDSQGTWPLIVHPDGTVEQDTTATLPKPAVAKTSKRKGRPLSVGENVPDRERPAPPEPPTEPAVVLHSLAPDSPDPSPPHDWAAAPHPSAGWPAPPPPQVPMAPAPPSASPPAPRPVAPTTPWDRGAGQSTTHASWMRSAHLWEEAINENNRARGFYRPVGLSTFVSTVEHSDPGPRAPRGPGY